MTVWNIWSGNCFMVIFTNFFLSPWTSINQVIPVGEGKFLCLYYIFINWFCTTDSIRKSEGEEDTNQKVSKTFCAKKSDAILPLSSLCCLGLSGSRPTLQLPSSGPCSHVPLQKCLRPFTTSPVPWCLGKASLQTRKELWCIQPDAQTGNLEDQNWDLNHCILLPLCLEVALCSALKFRTIVSTPGNAKFSMEPRKLVLQARLEERLWYHSHF